MMICSLAKTLASSNLEPPGRKTPADDGTMHICGATIGSKRALRKMDGDILRPWVTRVVFTIHWCWKYTHTHGMVVYKKPSQHRQLSMHVFFDTWDRRLYYDFDEASQQHILSNFFFLRIIASSPKNQTWTGELSYCPLRRLIPLQLTNSIAWDLLKSFAGLGELLWISLMVNFDESAISVYILPGVHDVATRSTGWR